MPKRIFIIAAASLLISSCAMKQEEISEKPVARVFDQYLFPSDLKGHIPQGLDPEDSVRITRRLIEEWIRNRLLLKQAEIHLPESLKNVDRQVDENRSSQLNFKYKQNLLTQNLDSLIDEREVENYYLQNASNYVLENDIVQAIYIKLPSKAERLNEVRRWYRSDQEEHASSLREYCLEHAESYAIDDTTWINFTDLLANTPLNIDNPSRYLNYNRFIETSDANYHYFIRILNRKKEGEVKPLSMVQENIRTVLLNKRKLEYVQELENSVYKEGLSRNQVEIY